MTVSGTHAHAQHLDEHVIRMGKARFWDFGQPGSGITWTGYDGTHRVLRIVEAPDKRRASASAS
jgi:calcineurin-like phosphoesterase